MVTHDVVLDALGDRTRRAILETLREGPKPVVEIARGLPVGRPAVSQHLKVLKESGLVSDHAVAPGGSTRSMPRGWRRPAATWARSGRRRCRGSSRPPTGNATSAESHK